jgi:hypothetical protein
MKPNIAFVATRHSALREPYRWIYTTIMLLLTPIAFVSSTNAQSKDRDNPTPLTSNEISDTIRPDNKGDNYHYSFVAGSGEITITLTVVSGGHVNQVHFDLYDEDAKWIAGKTVTAGRGTSEQVVEHVQITRRQPVLLRIILSRFYFGPGKYRVHISGAVDFGDHRSGGIGSTDELRAIFADPQECLQLLPKTGALRVKMKDGSIKRIDLSQTEEITIEH